MCSSDLDHPPVRTRSNHAVTAAIILTSLSVPTSVFHAWPTNETRSRGNWVAKSAGMKREKNDTVSHIGHMDSKSYAFLLPYSLPYFIQINFFFFFFFDL